MMDRIQRAARARAAMVKQALAEKAEAQGGIGATVTGDAVLLEGRNLLDRWVRNAALRQITGGRA